MRVLSVTVHGVEESRGRCFRSTSLTPQCSRRPKNGPVRDHPVNGSGLFSPRPARRRGVAVLMVLLTISIALSVAYVSMRSQTTSSLVQRNANLRASARQAAVTGLAIALKNMQSTSWSGVDTTFVQLLGSGQRFEATFTTGDTSLVPGDPDYPEYPYRVTVLVTGYAADPMTVGSQASHVIRAVVRLVPRKLSEEPSGWSDIIAHTFCQWNEGDFSLTVPFRIQGSVRIRAILDLSKNELNWSDSGRRLYLDGLNALRLAGLPDWRPFSTRDGESIRFRESAQRSDTCSLLRDTLALNTENASSDSALFHWVPPVASRTYRLYPGGKSYNVELLPSDLRDFRREPDPVENPLGIFVREGKLNIFDDVTICGTLVIAGRSSGDLKVEGKNVQLLPADLPKLERSDESGVPIRLPTLIVDRDMTYCPIGTANAHSPLGGGARVGAGGIAAGATLLPLDDVNLNTTDPDLVPIGAHLTIGSSPTIYVVTARVSNTFSPTTRVTISPPILEGEDVSEGDSVVFPVQPLPSSQLTIVGLAAIADGFTVEDASQDASAMSIHGKVAAKDVYVERRAEWDRSSIWWTLIESWWKTADEGALFPIWLRILGLDPEPRMAIWPDDTNIAYHWQKSDDTIYVPDPADGGLRWELLNWTDNP